LPERPNGSKLLWVDIDRRSPESAAKIARAFAVRTTSIGKHSPLSSHCERRWLICH
jgi:hypothetical protein